MLTKNTEQLKQRVAEHVAADSIIQGIYWDTVNLRGCFIGCLAHNDDPSINEATYGLPIAVQRIAESIFEALPADKAKAFFAALPDAVQCDGKDLGRVHWQFLAAAAAARAAAWAAAWAAAVAAAADAARAAAWAADAADAARLRQRDLLLQLIADAPVVEGGR